MNIFFNISVAPIVLATYLYWKNYSLFIWNYLSIVYFTIPLELGRGARSTLCGPISGFRLPQWKGCDLGLWDSLQLRQFWGRLTAEHGLPATHSTADKINPSDLKGKLESPSQCLLQKQTLDNLFTGMYWKNTVFTKSTGGLENQAQEIATRGEQQEKHAKDTPQEQSGVLGCCCRYQNLFSPPNGLSTLLLPYWIMSLLWHYCVSPLRYLPEISIWLADLGHMSTLQLL